MYELISNSLFIECKLISNACVFSYFLFSELGGQQGYYLSGKTHFHIPESFHQLEVMDQVIFQVATLPKRLVRFYKWQETAG